MLLQMFVDTRNTQVVIKNILISSNNLIQLQILLSQNIRYFNQSNLSISN